MVVEAHNGIHITFADDAQALVQATADGVVRFSLRERDDLHATTARLTSEEAAKLAVALLRERSLVVNGHG